MKIKKLRKRTRRNWKRETRKKFRFLMHVAKQKIKNATNNYCEITRSDLLNEYFALWLVSKKLEAKGFKCSLVHWDMLFIKWGK